MPFTYEGGEGGGDNAFYIDMWSDYDFEIFECFQEDAVSEAPDSEDELDEEEEAKGGEGKGAEDVAASGGVEGDEGKEQGNAEEEGKGARFHDARGAETGD